MSNEVSPLEIDLLLLFYTFSDQHGRVNIPQAKEWAKNKLGVILQDVPFTLAQTHVDVLMDHGVLPDIRELLLKLSKH